MMVGLYVSKLWWANILFLILLLLRVFVVFSLNGHQRGESPLLAVCMIAYGLGQGLLSLFFFFFLNFFPISRAYAGCNTLRKRIFK